MSTTSFAEEIIIIANNAYPADSISLTMVRDIYLGEKTTEDGLRIKPYDQNNPEIRRKFLVRVLGMSEDRYNAYWIKKVFQEGGAPPVKKSSSLEVIEGIRAEVGGIGYVWRHEGGVSGIKTLLKIDAGD